MAVYLAPSLVVLRAAINTVAPNRDKASDGWIGNEDHCPGTSDHCPDSDGMVHAIDVDVDFRSPYVTASKLVNLLLGDPRLQYIIWNRTIWSRTWGWTAKSYTGDNPHDKHIHFSIRHTASAEQSLSSWGLGALIPPPPLPVINPLIVASVESEMPYLLIKHSEHAEVFALFSSGLVRHVGPAEFEVLTNTENDSVPVATTHDQAEYTRLVEAALALRK